MSRPEHLNVPNTAAGIRRINELQEHYDADPEGYERREREQQEETEREEYELYQRQHLEYVNSEGAER